MFTALSGEQEHSECDDAAGPEEQPPRPGVRQVIGQGEVQEAVRTPRAWAAGGVPGVGGFCSGPGGRLTQQGRQSFAQ